MAGRSVTVAIFALLVSVGSPAPTMILIASIVQYGSILLILVRFGVLPLAVGVFVSDVLNRFSLTPDLSAWYALNGRLPVLLILALAIWSFRTALGRRKVWAADGV